MSTPEGPDRPRDDDQTARPQGPYPDPPYGSYGPAPYEPYAPPPYPPQQYGGPQYGGPQYGQQPYGGQPPYGGYPQTAPPNRPPNRTPLIIATVAVVVVALVVLGVVLLTNGDDDKPAAQSPPATGSAPAPTPSASASNSTPSATAATSPPASPTGSLTPTTVKQITVPSVISGWHGVLSYKENVAYDVPPGWTVETPGTLVGFEDNGGQPTAIIHGVSTYKDNACPGVSGSYRGHAGFKTAGDVDPTSAARSGLKTFADGVALKPNGSYAPISRTTLEDIKVDQGKIRAKYARATVTLDASADCGSPSVVVVAVAFRNGPNTALFIGYFDQGVADALPLPTAKKIFTTLRPYQR